jgi:hypothetical protein
MNHPAITEELVAARRRELIEQAARFRAVRRTRRFPRPRRPGQVRS